VLLVTLDTTRADRIAAYGCPDVRTPVLDRLARGGALLEQAIADVPVTLPSHTTLMTGVPAIGHGVRYNADFTVGPAAETLAERFAARGYDTGAVVSTLVLDSKFGLDQGFAHYDDDLTPGYVKYDESLYSDQTHWLPKADRRADETAARAVEWLGRTRRPFFLWAHFYDPHFPYDPPPPWGRASEDPYRAEIQFTDHELGRILGRIAEVGRAGDTVVLVVADHGEGLDQHCEDGHGIFVYDETVRVPLIAWAPGVVPAGRVVSEQVRTVDVAPTLLELAGDGGRLGVGGSLVPLLRGEGPAPDPAAYSESIKTRLLYGGSGLKAVRTAQAKFIWAPFPELYDLRSDPGETRNLVAADPALAGAMTDRLARLVRDGLDPDRVFVQATDLDEATREGLAGLGYVSGGNGGLVPGTFAEEMELRGNDPKALVDVSMSAREIQNGYLERGEQKLLRFFRTARPPEEDRNIQRLWAAAHQNYAKIHVLRQEWALAAQEYGRALEVDPDYEPARWNRIHALNLAGESDVAEREAAAMLERWPDSWRVRLHRGLALALLGRREEAREELSRVAQAAPAEGTAARNAQYYLDHLGEADERAVLTAYSRPGDD